MSAMTPLVAVIPPVVREPHAVGANCMIRQSSHTDFAGAMSPLVLADHFVMTGPTFELHPHAGMSAVTVLFENSRGTMSSHDSVHNNHHIEPGDLHWTLAGRGIVHTQRPEGNNTRLDGLQLFVNLPAKLKRIAPRTLLLRSVDVPLIQTPGVRLRLLVGNLEGRQSPLSVPQSILIVDGTLSNKAETSIPLQAGWNLWLYARRGELAIKVAGECNDVTLSHGEATAIATMRETKVTIQCIDHESAFVVIAGPAINEPVVQLGPFVMTSQEEAQQAFADYRAGKFGAVLPFAR